MKTKNLWLLWGLLYIVCAFAGFIRGSWGPGWLWSGVALAFFVPPFWLLYRAKKAGEAQTVKLLRCLAALSLVLTSALLLANFLSVLAPEALGLALHSALTIVSVPMMDMDWWAVSLFAWAFLLAGSFGGKGN